MYMDIHDVSRRRVIYSKPKIMYQDVEECIQNWDVTYTDVLRCIQISPNLRNFVIEKY